MNYKVVSYPLGYSNKPEVLQAESRLHCGSLKTVYVYGNNPTEVTPPCKHFVIVWIKRSGREYKGIINKITVLKA